MKKTHVHSAQQNKENSKYSCPLPIMPFHTPLVPLYDWYDDHSILGIDDASLRDLESSLVLSQAGRIEDLADTLFGLSLPEVESGSTGMREHVSPDWLLGICVGHSVSRISHHLVSHVDSHVELLGQFHQFAQDLPQNLLSLGELSSAGVVIAKDCHDGIDDKQRMRALHHHGRCEVQ